MSGNKTLYTTEKCRSMTTQEEFVETNEYGSGFVKDTTERLMSSVLDGYSDLYPKEENDNIITSTEINAVESAGYVFISVSLDSKGKVRALFKNLKD